jgi:hypothetical protein
VCSLVSASGQAIDLTSGPITIAATPGICYSDPDVASVGGEFITVFSKRTCGAGTTDASVSAVRYNVMQDQIVGMPFQVHAIAGSFTSSFGRIAATGPTAIAIVAGLQNAMGWTITRLNTGPGFVPLMRTNNTLFAAAFDKFAFDCTPQGCGLASAGVSARPVNSEVWWLGPDGADRQMISSIVGETVMTTVQIGPSSNVLFTQNNVAQRTIRYDVGASRSTVLPPLGIGTNIASLAGARLPGGLVVWSSDAAGGLYESGDNLAAIGPTPIDGNFSYYHDADARASVVALVGVIRTMANTREYFVRQRSMNRAIRDIASIPGPPFAGGVVRVALETGRNHLGTGLVVYEYEGPQGREIRATRLQCTDALDCDDGDLGTPDVCGVVNRRTICIRNVNAPDAGDAGMDAALTDVPSAPTDSPNVRDVFDGSTTTGDASAMDARTTGVDGGDGAMTALDAKLDGDSSPLDAQSAMDATTDSATEDSSPLDGDSEATDAAPVPLDAPRDASPSAVQQPGIFFGGGSCGCRTPTNITPPSRTALMLIAAMASVYVNRRRRRSVVRENEALTR